MTKTGTFLRQTKMDEQPTTLHFKIDNGSYDSIHIPALREKLPELKEGDKCKLHYTKCSAINDWWITKITKE